MKNLLVIPSQINSLLQKLEKKTIVLLEYCKLNLSKKNYRETIFYCISKVPI